MILYVTRKLSGTSDILMHVFAQRNIDVFRFNLDLFYKYQFLWNDDQFEIEDPIGRLCNSNDIDIMIFYKGLLSTDEPVVDIDTEYTEPKWIKSWMNTLHSCLFQYGTKRNKVRLWQSYESLYPKTLQMFVAKEYFEVPDFNIHWGFSLPSKQVIAKPLTSRSLDTTQEYLYSKIVDREQLDPKYPWFTQNIADGDRDATVLYVNGNVHCYKFATPRGNLTDWRVTQGTEVNKWELWDAGKDFENRVDAYMKKLGLVFGRLDFIIGGREPQFLEVNPNGQFGWLDDEKWTLHNEVVDAILDPNTTIKI